MVDPELYAEVIKGAQDIARSEEAMRTRFKEGLMEIQVSEFDSFDEEARAYLLEEANNVFAAIGDDAFHVTDHASASWVTDKMQSWRSEIERIKATAAAEVKRREAMIQYFTLRFEQELESFARSQLSGDRKTTVLSNGIKLSFRKIAPKLDVRDEDAFLDWAKAWLPEAVVVKESVSKTAVNGHWKDTGEIPQGCEVQPERVGFYIQG